MKLFLVALALSLAFFAMAMVALRRRVLREQIAVLWLGLSVVLVLLSISLPFHLLDKVAHLLGIAYGSDLLFLLAVVFLMLLVFQLSVSLARLSAKFTRLVQDVAIQAAERQPSEVDSGDGTGEL